MCQKSLAVPGVLASVFWGFSIQLPLYILEDQRPEEFSFNTPEPTNQGFGINRNYQAGLSELNSAGCSRTRNGIERLKGMG